MKKKKKSLSKNKRKKKKQLFKNMKIICLSLIIISIILISIELVKNQELKRNIKNLNKYNTKETITFSNIENNGINFNELYQKNSDVKGWIKVNNTKIDYPVVQGNDNEYYLNHSFDKTVSSFGWVFLDYRNNLENLDSNTIIYAHTLNYSNSEMFTSLKKVLSEDWYKNEDNQLITITTPDKIMLFKIFSIYTIPNETYYLTNNFSTKTKYKNFLKTLFKRSINNFNINVTEKDKIITLSTCYKEKERLVVHAKLKEVIFN